jgi:hypothetical protein
MLPCQAFTVEVQAASAGGPDDAAVTVCHGTLDVAALAGARDAGTPMTVTVELPHKAGAPAQPVDGESPVPAVTLDVRCIRVKHVDAGEGVADNDGAAAQAPAASGDTHPGAVTPPAPEAVSSEAGTGIQAASGGIERRKEQEVPLSGDAAGAGDGATQPAPASAQRLLTDSVAALSQRVHALERELMDAHSTAQQHAASLQAVQAQLVSSQEATHKAAEVKAALQEYTALLEAELETVKAERVASAAAVAEGDDGGAMAALDTARAQLAEALREADSAREALAAMKNQSREEAAASVAATEERLETEAAPAVDTAPAKDSAVGGEEEADLKAQLEATRRVLAATSAELAVARSETAAVRAHSSASAAEAAEGHASRLASLATALASKSARITELESHCEALQAQRTELAGLAQEATATAAAAMAAASSHAAVHAEGVAALAAAKSSGKETAAAMSGGSGIAPAACDMRIGALQAALDAAMQDNSVAEATMLSTNKKLADALARVAAADAALAANEEELRRIRSDAARVEAASAIRDAVDQATAQAEEDGEEDEEEDEEAEDERAALESLLEQAKAEAEAARTDARSLAVKLAAARRQLSLSSCAAADVEDASSSQAVAGAVGSPGGSVSESPGQAQNAGTPDAGVSRLRDKLANAHEELARVTDAAEAEGATLKAQLAELQDALTAARDENQTLRDSLAQSHGTVTSASETRKELTRAHARIALLEADKDSLQSKLIEAQADIRAANVAASSAHARASAAVAAVAAVRGAADDADDDDEGDSVPVAKYRRLEAALDTANRQLRELSECRDRQQAAMAVEFSAQYELRQKAEAALLQQLAAKDATMAQLEAEVAQMRQSALDIGSQMQELREDMRAGGDGAAKRIAERAEAALASTRDELAAMTASRDELERVLCAHLEELVAAKVESAEVQAKIIELKAELSAGRTKIERLAQKVTALEVKRYMSAEEAAQGGGQLGGCGCD